MHAASICRAIATLAATFAFAGGLQAQERLRVVGNFPANHTSTVAMEAFKAEVEKATGRELVVDHFPAMQLGGAQENVDQVRSGVAFMTYLSQAFLSRTVPELQVLSVPFLFSDRAQAFRVVDGKVGALLNDKLSAKGFVVLGFMELGPRHLTNNVRPVKRLADMQGLKIRLQPDETHLATFRALGTNPVTMDVKELYSALQQGVLDGQENPYAVILDRSFHQVQKHLSDTGHFFDFIVVVANKKKFEALKPASQKAVRDAMTNAIAAQRAKATEADVAALEELKKKGMLFTPVTPQFREEMRKASAGIADGLKKKIGDDLVSAVLTAAQ